MTKGYWKLFCILHSLLACWCNGYDFWLMISKWWVQIQDFLFLGFSLIGPISLKFQIAKLNCFVFSVIWWESVRLLIPWPQIFRLQTKTMFLKFLIFQGITKPVKCYFKSYVALSSSVALHCQLCKIIKLSYILAYLAWMIRPLCLY